MRAVSSSCQIIDATTCDTTSRFPITQYSWYLQTTQPITMDSAIKAQRYFIRAQNKKVLVFNYNPYYYWFRIIIKNPQFKSRPLMFVMAPFGLYDGLLFQKVNGKWQEVAHAGLRYRFESRSYQSTHHVFPFTLQPNSLDTIYVSLDANNAYKLFGFALIRPTELKIFENKIYFVFGIIVGLLILFFVINVSLFFALKERLHLWYALYIALLFLIVMKNDLLDQQFLGLDSEVGFRLTPFMTIGALAIAVLMHVVQGFLKGVLTYYRTLFYLSALVKANVLFSAVVHAFVFVFVSNYHIQMFVFNWAKISTLFGICMIIVDCLYCSSKGFKSALFLFSGSFVFMIGSVQRLFFPSTLSFLFPPTTFHIGIIVETVVITMGLIYKYWAEKELQRREIHDNIGSLLSKVKLNLSNFDLDSKIKANRKIADSEYLLTKAIQDLRDLLKASNTDTIAEVGIERAIEKELSMVQRASDIETILDSHCTFLKKDPNKELALFRIVQEALHNVIKHANASLVKVTLTCERGKLHLIINDNGEGFDVSNKNTYGSGLGNMKNRCKSLNAKLNIQSNIGKGTEINITLPIS